MAQKKTVTKESSLPSSLRSMSRRGVMIYYFLSIFLRLYAFRLLQARPRNRRKKPEMLRHKAIRMPHHPFSAPLASWSTDSASAV